MSKKYSKKDKEIWNDAVRATLLEVAKYDGIISGHDRRYMVGEILNKVSYKFPIVKKINIPQ